MAKFGDVFVLLLVADTQRQRRSILLALRVRVIAQILNQESWGTVDWLLVTGLRREETSSNRHLVRSSGDSYKVGENYR